MPCGLVCVTLLLCLPSVKMIGVHCQDCSACVYSHVCVCLSVCVDMCVYGGGCVCWGNVYVVCICVNVCVCVSVYGELQLYLYLDRGQLGDITGGERDAPLPVRPQSTALLTCAM